MKLLILSLLLPCLSFAQDYAISKDTAFKRFKRIEYDTVPVWMLISKKDAEGFAYLKIGYEVCEKGACIYPERIMMQPQGKAYLDSRKRRLSDGYIVWLVKKR